MSNHRSYLLLSVGLLLILGACTGGEERSGGPPRLAIAYSNDLRGEIRSCGCAAHDLGGLGRRATFLATLRDSTRADVLLVDGGDFFSSSVNYGIEKAELTMKSMALMQYHAVVPGENEFGFGLDFLRRRAREVGLPLIAANVFDTAADTLLFDATREVTLESGLRVGIVGALAATLALPPQVAAGTLTIRDPLPILQEHVDRLRPRVDVVVVLVHMGRGETQRLAEKLVGVDAVVHGHDGKPMRQVRRFGEAYVLQIATRGLHMGVAYATLGPDRRIAALSNAVVDLDDRFADDEAIAKLFAVYDLDVATKERSSLPVGITDARNRMDAAFLGADGCRPCHAGIHDAWAASKHAHAFDLLAAQNRQFDRDCTPCHTTGFYNKGGFETVVATPHLTNIQCESCHGNAAEHAQNPTVRTATEAHTTCRACHTVDQTPDFVFESFWARIDHGKGP